MKITFVYMGTVNLGIEYLGAMLQAHGHSVDLVFDPALFDDKRYFHSPFLSKIFNQEKKIIDDVINTNPDLIAFGVITDNYRWACRLAKELKKRIPEILIIFGGAHPTLMPKQVIKNNFVDFVIAGEGEYALLELVECIEKKKQYENIKNVWYKINGVITSNPLRPLIDNLDELPFPNKELFQKHIPNQDEYIIISGRGCPYNCTFCCNHVFQKIYKDKGSFVRRRSVDHVLKELKLGKEKYNFKTIYFADEVFTFDKEWIKKFAEKYPVEIKVSFKCVSHPLLLDEEIVSLLKKAGCYAIQIGVQSLDEEVKKNLLRRPESNNAVKKAVEVCRKNGITIIVDHIFGLPGEEEEHLQRGGYFYADVNPHRITSYTLSYFPRTDIVETAKKMGIVDEKKIESIETGGENSYINCGSIQNKKQKQLIKNFTVLFTLIPFLSKKITEYIIKNKIYKFFYLVPKFFLMPFDLLTVMFITHEWRGINYLKYYYRELKKFFRFHLL